MHFNSLVTFIFIFNAALMPLMGLAHEQTHETHEGNSQITWNEDQASSALFQITHDDHHEYSQQDISTNSSQLDNHHCHHVSVLGIPSTFLLNRQLFSRKSFNPKEPLFSIQLFPSRIDYPPKNT